MVDADRKERLGTILLAFIICLTAAMPAYAENKSSTGSNILYFIGSEVDGAAALEWATVTEFDTDSFDIERAESKDGPFVHLAGPIPALGGVFGAMYDVVDKEVVEYQTYWYILIENKTDGSTYATLPLSVTVGTPPNVFLPVIR